jgi:hypothetical protein
MSEYRWNVKGIWVGIEGPEPDRKLQGVIQRSGVCHQLGHFCHVKVSVNGRKVWASGAEDRTFYFHVVEWKDIGGVAPKDMVPALGWCKGGHLFAFKHEGKIVATGRGVDGKGLFIPIERELWQEDWSEDQAG